MFKNLFKSNPDNEIIREVNEHIKALKRAVIFDRNAVLLVGNNASTYDVVSYNTNAAVQRSSAPVFFHKEDIRFMDLPCTVKVMSVLDTLKVKQDHLKELKILFR